MLERRKFETASIMVSFHQNCYSLFVFTHKQNVNSDTFNDNTFSHTHHI